jgi:hypothetical protein
MTPQRWAAGLALLVAVAGCAESTEIRSYPLGARIAVNGRFIGTSPVTFTVPRQEFAAQEFTVTAEHEGYEPGEIRLQKRICPGRIVGGVFTLGIVLLFRPPSCFASPQYIALLARPAPPVEQKPTGSERLDHLEKLRDAGKITPEEYWYRRSSHRLPLSRASARSAGLARITFKAAGLPSTATRGWSS